MTETAKRRLKAIGIHTALSLSALAVLALSAGLSLVFLLLFLVRVPGFDNIFAVYIALTMILYLAGQWGVIFGSGINRRNLLLLYNGPFSLMAAALLTGLAAGGLALVQAAQN